jgi:hypothetical protein
MKFWSSFFENITSSMYNFAIMKMLVFNFKICRFFLLEILRFYEKLLFYKRLRFYEKLRFYENFRFMKYYVFNKQLLL